MAVMWLPLCFLGGAVLFGIIGLTIGGRYPDGGLGVALTAAALLIAFLVLVPSGYAVRAACNRVGSSYDVGTEWAWIGGCYVEAPNGRLVPQGQWIVPDLSE